MQYEVNLFGEQAAGTQNYFEHIPFTSEEVQACCYGLTERLLQQFSDSVLAMRHEIKESISAEVISAAKKRFWENMDWLYELSETPAALPFDVVCDYHRIDSEIIRQRISSEFANEIRSFLSLYACADKNDSIRVARKLSLYIDVHVTH